MSTIYRSYSMDYTSQREHAQRADGQWFTRRQSRGRYGYRWSAWEMTTGKPEQAYVDPYAGKARLPKAVA
jgi:hypothetical protein